MMSRQRRLNRSGAVAANDTGCRRDPEGACGATQATAPTQGEHNTAHGDDAVPTVVDGGRGSRAGIELAAQ